MLKFPHEYYIFLLSSLLFHKGIYKGRHTPITAIIYIKVHVNKVSDYKSDRISLCNFFKSCNLFFVLSRAVIKRPSTG